MAEREPPTLTLVTGASGWLGAALLERLEADRPGTIRVLDGDIGDPDALARFTNGAAGADVIHAAGVIHPPRVADFERVNHGGTVALLAAARQARVRRLVHVSSNSPFGFNATPEDRFRADEPYRPYLGYGESKMRAEQAVRAAHGDGIETTVVRPPWFYGPHQPARQTRFFTAVRTGRFPIVGRGENRRSMIYVPALADGIVRAELAEQAGGRAYWLADARPYAMTEIVETVRAALRAEGYEVSDRTPRLPALAGRFAQRADAALQRHGRYISELHVLGEMGETIACDVSAARDELGFVPPESLLDGMRASIRWCQEQGIEL